MMAAELESQATTTKPATLRPWLVLGTGMLTAVLLVALPYLPGNHDVLAAPLSALTQLFAYTGLPLVVFGAVWAISAKLPRRERPPDVAAAQARRTARAAVVTATVLLVLSALVAAVQAGLILWFWLALTFVTTAVQLLRAIRAGRIPADRLATWGPRFLIAIPLTATLARTVLVPALGEASRMRAMDRAGTLIEAIEQYRQQHGRYPLSLASLNADFPPDVRGVRRYLYEPAGDAYNVYFEHLAEAFDTREIIVYNPRGEQRFTSHDRDLLEYSGEDLERRRGYYAVLEAPRPNWKRFLFD